MSIFHYFFHRLLQLAFLLLLIFTYSIGQAQNDQHEELGEVHWLRDYNKALQLAKDEDKNILILFQEVPGCATCRNYGHNVLSHPLMVEAIENLFIPLAVFNNKGGADKEVLQKYNEPSWNNPVVRIINEESENMIDRIAADYSALGLYSGMVKALRSNDKDVPHYFALLGEELKIMDGKNVEEKTFSMYCFWSGEKHFGGVDGVLATEPGFADHKEVVKVMYDPEVISAEQLEQHGVKEKMIPTEESKPFRLSNSDRQYHLKQTEYKYLPLTSIQRTKINSALGRGLNAEKYLSPKQLEWLKEIRKSGYSGEVQYVKEFQRGWKSMDF